jgi:hypothetical protein
MLFFGSFSRPPTGFFGPVENRDSKRWQGRFSFSGGAAFGPSLDA